MVTEVKLVQSEKAPLPILVTLLGMVKEVSLVHPEKAEEPMLVILLGIVIEARFVHPEKAEEPMLLTWGISRCSIFVPLNALSGMVVMEDGSSSYLTIVPLPSTTCTWANFVQPVTNGIEVMSMPS